MELICINDSLFQAPKIVVKSRSVKTVKRCKKKCVKRAGAGERQGSLSPIFPAATAPFPKLRASYFRSVGFNTSPPGGAGGKLLPIHSLKWNPNDVLTTCKAISKVLPADLCSDHAHYVKNHRFNGFEKKQNHGGPRRDIYATYSCAKLIRTAEELSYRAVACFAANLRQVQVASRYRPLSSSCDLFIRIVLNFTFEFKVLTDRNKRSETLWSVTICLFRYDMYRCELIFIRLSWIYLLPINLTLFPIFFISIIISIVLWCPRSAKTM